MHQPLRHHAPSALPRPRALACLAGAFAALALAILAGTAQGIDRDPTLPHGVIARSDSGSVVGLYGPLRTDAPEALRAAEIALAQVCPLLEVDGADLQPEALPGRSGPVSALMTNPDGPGPKFWFVTYAQTCAGLPVLGTRVGVLVRNAPGLPVVAVKSNVRRLRGFVPAEDALLAPALAASIAGAIAVFPGLHDVTTPRIAVWAGTEDAAAPPCVALEFMGDVGLPDQPGFDRVRIVADARTGRILVSESLVCDADIAVTTRGQATVGLKADTCGPEAPSPLPYLGVVFDGATTFTDAAGTLTIPWPGTTPVTLSASVAGARFATHRAAGGADELLSLTITPPGPAVFEFNAPNTTAAFRSAVNAYLHANIAYDFIAGMTPSIVQSECPTPFDIFFHGAGGARFTPPKGDHCSDGSRASVSLPAASGTMPSSAYSTVMYHEYGHHIANLQGYAGANSYNEGMADTIAMLVSDQPDLFVGSGGNCTTPLRTAQNAIMYPCRDILDVHTCGQLLSGCFWDLRQQLAQTDPTGYRHTLAELALSSIALHVGSGSIGPSIFLDVLALDNDGTLPLASSGSPHWREIQAAFALHRMTLGDFTGAGSDLQPGPLAFTFSPEPPTNIAPGQAAIDFEITVATMYGNEPADGSAWLYTDETGDGVFTPRDLTRLGPNHYRASVPVPLYPIPTRYYIRAVTADGRDSYFPAAAPLQCVALSAMTRAEELATFEFNGSLQGWTADPPGSFDVLAPQIGALASNGRIPPVGPELGVSAMLAPVMLQIVDGEPAIIDTTATSPAVDTRGCDGVRVSYARWYSDTTPGHNSNSYATVEVSGDDGQTWTTLEQIGPGGPDAAGEWRFKSFTIAPSTATRLRVNRHSVPNQGSVLIFLDRVVIDSIRACPADFDANGFVNGDDSDFFMDAFLAGTPCADFDGNGFVNGDDSDFFMDAFFAGC